MFRAFCMVSGGSVKTDGCNGVSSWRERGKGERRGEREEGREELFTCVSTL